MTEDNIKRLQNLSKTSKRSGVLPVFLGLIILFIGAFEKDTNTACTGLFVFIVGYAFIKIGKQIKENL